MEAQKFAKPPKRIRDPKAMALYRARVRHCECGCGTNRGLQLHHIVSRKMGGDDLDDNFLMLAHSCHAAWHTVGGHEFYRRHVEKMSEEVVEKCRRALRLEES